ncbi:hypothetical protein K490DRAFT_54107 [Saccharata proteae CBS 121410]|uniref:Protein kinase domain-containing protein n=1 Tax=Saccharata proteae CBS 121410 TaxID=1314787 RepID=A0A9P4LZB8_9PEZI|nr:hypothetical protein K490DRAFT_54107 [Saccharata proteae CBS 121410]
MASFQIMINGHCNASYMKSGGADVLHKSVHSVGIQARSYERGRMIQLTRRKRIGDSRQYLGGEVLERRLCTDEGTHNIRDVPSMRKLPETFLWYLFHQLATACVVMETGQMNPAATALWQAPRTDGDGLYTWNALRQHLDTGGYIIHADIKPNNIFLAEIIQNRCPFANEYPRPVVADFGSGSEANPGPKLPLPGSLGNRNRFLPSNNVHSVGLAMWCAIMAADLPEIGQDDDHPSQWTWYTPNRRGVIVDLNRQYYLHDARDAFSDELLDLVEECLRFRPEQRPSAEYLRWATGKVMDQIQAVTTRQNMPLLVPHLSFSADLFPLNADYMTPNDQNGWEHARHP